MSFADRESSAMLPVKDLERAKRWYADVLEFSPKTSDQYGATYQLGKVPVYMYQTQYAGTAEHTLLSFSCTDLVSDMADLRAKGANFIDYDLPGLKTVDGMATFGPVKNAWVHDSEGNVIGFVEGM